MPFYVLRDDLDSYARSRASAHGFQDGVAYESVASPRPTWDAYLWLRNPACRQHRGNPNNACGGWSGGPGDSGSYFREVETDADGNPRLPCIVRCAHITHPLCLCYAAETRPLPPDQLEIEMSPYTADDPYDLGA